MIDELWEQFRKANYSGSVSVRKQGEEDQVLFAEKSSSPEDDSMIHEAIYGLDPDYTKVCVITAGFEGDKSALPVVSFAGNAAEALDQAVLEGLAHRKALIVKESGAIVKFGYKDDEII